MIEGMQLLETFRIGIHHPGYAWLFIILGLPLICWCAQLLNRKCSTIMALLYSFGLVIATIFIGLSLLLFFCHYQPDKILYKVKAVDKINIVEFNEQYTVYKREGDVYYLFEQSK